MSKAVLVIGETGTGKSTAIRNLPPKETFILNVLNKPLPFKGANKKYKVATKDDPQGNMVSTDKHDTIKRILHAINKERTEIKYLIVDDFTFVISNHFMRKAYEKGFDKYVEIGKDCYDLVEIIQQMRDDLFIFVVMHSDLDNFGRSKPKTVGKMIDEKVGLPERFSIVLHSLVSNGEYVFQTNQDAQITAKSPMDMFDKLHIPNDYLEVCNAIGRYLEDDDEPVSA